MQSSQEHRSISTNAWLKAEIMFDYLIPAMKRVIFLRLNSTKVPNECLSEAFKNRWKTKSINSTMDAQQFIEILPTNLIITKNKKYLDFPVTDALNIQDRNHVEVYILLSSYILL